MARTKAAAAKAKQNASETQQMKEAARFTKKQLLASRRFEKSRDLIDALLAGDRLYSAEEAQAIIDEYMKCEVN